jgi:predicted RNA-binding Zn-ribbon protein involved in translation (DUF1610 family)
MVDGTETPGQCPNCGVQSLPGATRCRECGAEIPIPFDVDYSGFAHPKRSWFVRPVPTPGVRAPWWVYFWTGALLVWGAIALFVFLAPGGIVDVVIIAMVIAGPCLISYSYYALVAADRRSAPA